jgi:hypothetical protein
MSKTEVWVQIHHVPPKTFTDERLMLMMQSVGEPISEIREFYLNGERYHKVKVKRAIFDPLKDKLLTRHPTLGKVKNLLTYEKLQRVSFVAVLGTTWGHA